MEDPPEEGDVALGKASSRPASWRQSTGRNARKITAGPTAARIAPTTLNVLVQRPTSVGAMIVTPIPATPMASGMRPIHNRAFGLIDLADGSRYSPLPAAPVVPKLLGRAA